MQGYSSKLLLVSVFLSLSLVGNTTDAGSQGTPIPKVKSVSRASDEGIFTYDSQGRISKFVMATKGISSSYEYKAGAVFKNDFENSTLKERTHYLLNQNGLAMTSTQSSKPGEMLGYEYNKGGYLIQESVQEGGKIKNTKKYTYNNENILQRSEYFVNNVFASATYFEHDTGRINTLKNGNFGQTFLGKLHKYPVTKETNMFGTNPQATRVLKTNYRYDSLERIVGMATETNRIKSEETIYSYY